MPGSLQNKLLQFEVAPPADVWDKISHRLDEEFVASDSQVAEALENASITPPAGVWDKVNATLHDEMPAVAAPRKVVPLFVRIAVAAAVIGILVLGGLYFLRSNKPENNIVKTFPEKTLVPPAVTHQQQKAPDTGNNALIANNQSTAPKVRKEIARPVPKPRITEEVVNATNDHPAQPSTDFSPNPAEAPLYDLQTVSALQPVSVNAPPLRDNKGNIIMDASLISRPDDEYITVTGPNGKQTKISSKFLSCLSYINASINSNDDSRANQCKSQFDEWRRKIIAQPAFIPTANNFFDIFELKDLLQEM